MKQERDGVIRCTSWSGRWEMPTGRWMTFDEETWCMANFPLASDTIWAGHKNNPRPETGLVLSALERVELLRHAIRLAELQMARVRLAVGRTFRSWFPANLWMSQRWLAYANRPNRESAARVSAYLVSSWQRISPGNAASRIISRRLGPRSATGKGRVPMLVGTPPELRLT